MNIGSPYTYLTTESAAGLLLSVQPSVWMRTLECTDYLRIDILFEFSNTLNYNPEHVYEFNIASSSSWFES